MIAKIIPFPTQSSDAAPRAATSQLGAIALVREPRSLRVIAREVFTTWAHVNYAAVPYLEAMLTLDSIRDTYGCDSGASIVRYFLANARSWRGGDAVRIKAELKDMLASLGRR